MPQQLYTPFLAQSAQNIGSAFLQRDARQAAEQEKRLIGDAYLGDEAARQQLSQINPQALIAIDDRKRQREQQQLSVQGQQNRELAETAKQISREAAQFDTLEAANAHVEREKERLRPVFGDAVDQYTPFTPEEFQQTKDALQQEPSALEQARTEKLRAEIDALKQSSTGRDTKEILQIEKLVQDIEEKRTKTEVAKKEREQKEAAQGAEAVSAVQTVDDLLSKDLDKIYGSKESLFPDFLRSQEGIDMIAKRKNIGALLELAAAGKLKGQGQISEGERSILKESASVINNEKISPRLARAALEDAREIFAKTAARTGTPLPTTPATGNTIDDLVNKYAN